MTLVAGELLTLHAELFPVAVRTLAEYLEGAQVNFATHTRHKLSIIPEIMAACIDHFSSAFSALSVTEYPALSELLALGAQFLPSFPARIACFILLTHLHVTPAHLFDTLRSALYDVAHVRLQVMDILGEFRAHIPRELIPILIVRLHQRLSA